MLPAHGIGGVEGLPLDGELVLQTGGVVVLVSFLAVALLWTRPRFTGPVRGRRLPAAPAGVGTALRALTLAVTVAVVGYGFLGPQDPDANPVPRVLYVLFWIGIVPASLLLGPVWRVLNPLRLVHRVAAAALRRPVHDAVPLPARLGYRPAVAGLLAFAWLELVTPGRDRPVVVAGFLLGYGVLHTLAALRYGEGWFSRADAFEVYSTLAAAALAPFGRLTAGGVGLRNPLRGLAAVPVLPGLVGFVAVWWGSTVFDGLSGWSGWPSAPLLGSAVLAGLVLLVTGLHRAATGPLAGPLASTLVPIAVGYTIAHYVTSLLVEGPRALAQLAGRELGAITAVPAPGLVAVIQVGAVLVGHVVAVVAAHDRSVAALPAHRRVADQVPLVLLMVGYTMAGLFLLVIS